MNLYLICEPHEPLGFWISDIMDGIVKESVKKALNLVAITDGKVYPQLYCSGSSDSGGGDGDRSLVLVIGYSLPWIGRTLREVVDAGAEPILVSTHQHRFSFEYSYAAFDITQAMRTLTSYLASTGRTRLALFGIHKDTVGDIAKLSGFTDGLRQLGLPFMPRSLYFRGNISDCASSLCENIANYDAIVCPNDLQAIYLSLYMKERGIRVPDDIFLTGFGNWNVVDFFRPGITRMYTNLSELGCQAVRLHQYMQYNQKVKHCSGIIECELRVNESTGNLRFCDNTGGVGFTANNPVTSPPYYSDADIMETLKAELFIRRTDEIDRNILSQLLCGEKYFSISEKVNVSEQTVKYRVAKLIRSAGFNDRSELLVFIGKYNLFDL